MSEAQEGALLKALAFDSRDRWQSMKEFREALLGKSEEPAAPFVPPMMVSGRTAAEIATVRSGPVPTPSYQPPMTENAPVQYEEPKSKVPVWVWSVLGAVVVLGVLIAIRPKSTEPTQAPAPPPKVETAVSPAVNYDEALTKAQDAATPSADAVKLLEQAVASAPTRPEGHDALGQILLYKTSNGGEAAKHFAKAVELGGFVTFVVEHDRKDGTKGGGKLRLGKDSFSFVDRDGLHTFTTRKDDIERLRAQDAVIDVKLKSGESYHFAGTSTDKKAEAEMIARLAGEK
jgi:hypothetical protein